MEKKSLDIRNQDEVPSTHFFVHQNNKYPFNFDFFKHFSKYISEKQIQLEHTKEINLLDDKIENIPNFSKETIESFIKYVQRETISIDDHNVINLHFLAAKYKVSSLLKHTEDYIANHQDNLIFDLFLLHQKDGDSLITNKYEDMISEQLSKYINDERLLALGVPVLFRILTKYAQKKLDNKELAKSIEAFLFKCLDKYGKKASILFSVFENDQISIETIKVLVSKYFDVFDFHFINRQMIKQMYDEQAKIIDEFKSKADKQETEINQLKRDMKNKEDSEGEIRGKLIEYEDRIRKLDAENAKKDIKIQSQESEIKSLKDEISKVIEKIEKQGIVMLPFNVGHEFEGIIKHLISKNGGQNLHENKIIEVTSNSNYSGCPAKNLVGLGESDYYAEQASRDFWICFDFKQMQVEITHYSIKSYANYTQGHLKNWVFEVSNDGQKWNQIDEHHDCGDLRGYCVTKTFKTKPNNFSRYCRLHHTGDFWDYATSHHPGFNRIEFFGKLKTQ